MSSIEFNTRKMEIVTNNNLLYFSDLKGKPNNPKDTINQPIKKTKLYTNPDTFWKRLYKQEAINSTRYC